jgi:VWFA-related protein
MGKPQLATHQPQLAPKKFHQGRLANTIAMWKFEVVAMKKITYPGIRPLRRHITFCIAILLVSLLFSVEIEAQIEEEVSVSLMEIWVKVTDSGNRPVMDLHPEDFTIFIDGEKVETRCFDKTFDASSAASETIPAKLNTRRFVFFFDLLNTMPGDLEFLKGRIGEFLKTSFRETDEAMIFALLPSVHLGMVQPWTSDKKQLTSVIRKMKGNMNLEMTLDQNERILLELLNPLDTTQPNHPTESRGVGVRPTEGLHQARQLARNFAAQEENRGRITMNSFLSIASYLSNVSNEGRTVLVYISGGFPLFPGEHYFELVQRTVEDTFTAGGGDLMIVEHASNDLQNEVRNILGRLNRLNVTIYSLDANGLLTADRGAEKDSQTAMKGYNRLSRSQNLQDSLLYIARETGGTAFLNGQDYAHGLTQIVSDMENQYWLCADLPASKKHGRYRKIEVKVSRPGLSVRHRKGYVE